TGEVGTAHFDEIETAVVGGVDERGAPTPPAVTHTGRRGHVLEAAAAEVAVQPVAGAAVVAIARAHFQRVVDRRHEDVGATVAVVVGDGQSHRVLLAADAGGAG